MKKMRCPLCCDSTFSYSGLKNHLQGWLLCPVCDCHICGAIELLIHFMDAHDSKVTLYPISRKRSNSSKSLKMGHLNFVGDGIISNYIIPSVNIKQTNIHKLNSSNKKGKTPINANKTIDLSPNKKGSYEIPLKNTQEINHGPLQIKESALVGESCESTFLDPQSLNIVESVQQQVPFIKSTELTKQIELKEHIFTDNISTSSQRRNVQFITELGTNKKLATERETSKQLATEQKTNKLLITELETNIQLITEQETNIDLATNGETNIELATEEEINVDEEMNILLITAQETNKQFATQQETNILVPEHKTNNQLIIAELKIQKQLSTENDTNTHLATQWETNKDLAIEQEMNNQLTTEHATNEQFIANEDILNQPLLTEQEVSEQFVSTEQEANGQFVQTELEANDQFVPTVQETNQQRIASKWKRTKRFTSEDESNKRCKFMVINNKKVQLATGQENIGTLMTIVKPEANQEFEIDETDLQIQCSTNTLPFLEVSSNRKCFSGKNNKSINPQYFIKKDIELKRNLTCGICCKDFKTFWRYKNHSFIHKDRKDWPLKCDRCGEHFIQPESLTTHIRRTHLGIVSKKSVRNNVTCEHCYDMFHTARSYNEHMKTVHGTQPLRKKKPECIVKCEDCRLTFKSRRALFSHKDLVHRGIKDYLCQVCGKAFINKYSFKSHTRIHELEKSHSCTLCPKRFATKFLLRSHHQTHSGYKPHLCNVCHKAFRTSHRLKVHFRSHTGEKPFKCDICSHGFPSRQSLRNHKLNHLDNKMFKCSFCDKSFRAQTYLINHEKTHTRPYKCHLCERSFNAGWVLENHILTHTKDYRCKICSTSFPSARIFRKHSKSGSCAIEKMILDSEIILGPTLDFQ